MDDQDYNSVLDDYDKWLYPIINKLDDNDRQQRPGIIHTSDVG